MQTLPRPPHDFDGLGTSSVATRPDGSTVWISCPLLQRVAGLICRNILGTGSRGHIASHDTRAMLPRNTNQSNLPKTFCNQINLTAKAGR
jgi:hypothetical protein